MSYGVNPTAVHKLILSYLSREYSVLTYVDRLILKEKTKTKPFLFWDWISLRYQFELGLKVMYGSLQKLSH